MGIADTRGNGVVWVMRNDLRRKKKLPGFFDREVYDILDGPGSVSATAIPLGLNLALAPASGPAEETDAVFDIERTTVAEDGLFSEFEQEETGGSSQKEAAVKDFPPLKAGIAAPIPISDADMVAGWHGAAVVVDGTLYVLDQSSGTWLMMWRRNERDWVAIGRLSLLLARPPYRLVAIGKTGKGYSS